MTAMSHFTGLLALDLRTNRKEAMTLARTAFTARTGETAFILQAARNRRAYHLTVDPAAEAHVNNVMPDGVVFSGLCGLDLDLAIVADATIGPEALCGKCRARSVATLV